MNKINFVQLVNFIAASCFILLFTFLIFNNILPVLTPFIIAAILAYLLRPIVNFFYYRIKLPRSLSIILSLVLLLVFIVILFTSFIPPIIQQAISISNNSSTIINNLKTLFSQEKFSAFGYEVAFKSEQLESAILDIVQTLFSFFSQYVVQLTLNTISLFTIITFLFIITFYFLYDETLLTRDIATLLPLKTKKFLKGLREEIDKKLKNYLKGQLLLCLAVGIATWLGCVIVGLNNVLLLSFIAGVLEAIPIFGPIIATVPAIIIALTQSPTPFGILNWHYALLVIGIYFIVQRLENTFLVPVILGKSVDLHPVIILFAVSLGGYLGGILGIFLAVPIASIISIIIRYTSTYKF